MIESAQDREWLRGWSIVAAAKLGTRMGMGKLDAEWWLADLLALGEKDEEAWGMIGALYASGAMPKRASGG